MIKNVNASSNGTVNSSDLSGTTLPSTITGSSLTSLGTIASLNATSLTVTSNSTFTGNTVINGNISNASLIAPKENIFINGGALTANNNINLANGSFHLFTANSNANSNININWTDAITVNSVLNYGQVFTVAVAVTNGTTAYYPTNVKIDTTTYSPKWQGGASPTNGNSNGVDIYIYTIVKTANTPANYTVFASQTKFA